MKYLGLGAAFVSLIASSQTFALSWDDITLNGYFSFEYEKEVSGDREGDTNGSFDSDLIDLVFNFQPSDKLRIATDLTWEHGPATEDGTGNVATEYAFAEYTFQDRFRVRAGKMFTSFGIYNELHTAKPATLTVKEPQSTNKNNKIGSDIRFYPRWVNGVAFVGDGQLSSGDYDYNVQVTNGTVASDEDQYSEDDNTHKAVTARYRYTTLGGARYGVSYYQDTYADDNGGTEVTSMGVQAEAGLGNGFSGEFEYVMGDTQDLGDEAIDRNAYTLMLSHNTTKNLTPYMRYEFLDPDTDTDDDEFTVAIAGINYQFDKNAYFKLEADSFSGEANNAELADLDYVELKASLSIGF